VVVTGAPPPALQWKKNGVVLAGATNATLAYLAVQAGDAGSYTVVASNELGSGTSAAAVLVVNYAPAITSQPVAATINQGQSGTLTVVATGVPAPTYTWRKGGLALTGNSSALTATLVVANAQAGDGGSYDVVVTNSQGTVTSAAVVVGVNLIPVITTPPVAQAGNVGGSVAFTVVATGTPAPSYQWFKETVLIGGATSATYPLSGLSLTDAGSYKVVVTNVAGSVTSANATLVVNVPPVITTAPVAQTVAAGTSANFAVVATGQPVPTYQWKFNGNVLAGATNAGLTVLATTLGDSGGYTVVVTNAGGSVTSAAAVLTVNAPPVITQQPSGRVVALGGAVSFGVVATGVPVPTYQWFKDGAAIAGATNASYAIAEVQATQAGEYTVTASNSLGAVTSANATLVVNRPVAITTPPANVTVSLGQAVSFTVVATGTAPLAYQWKRNGVEVPGANAVILTLAEAGLSAAGNYTVVVSNAVNAVESAVAVLVVNTAPAITTPPAGQTVGVGARVIFSVVATGSPAPTYQWKFNGGVMNGETGATLTLAAAQLSQAGAYAVVVTNAVGVVTSAAASLTVVTAPVITSQPVSQSVNIGGEVSLRVTAVGQEPLVYQWRKGGNPIAGATSARQTFLVGGMSDAGSYDVIVAAGGALLTVTSGAAELTVNPAPIFGVGLAGAYGVAAGAGLTMTAADELPLTATMQWKRNGLVVAGANGRTLVLAAVHVRDGGWYQLVSVANGVTATSAAVFVRVTLPTAVEGWGLNSSGQAVAPAGLNDAVEIAAGYDHSLARRADGTVVAWGGNLYGQRNVPAGLRGVVQVAAGLRHSLALRSDGSVVAWGESGSPQVAVPVGLRDIVAIAAGRVHSLALKADGTVVGWGASSFGQEAVPLGLVGVVAVGAGAEHSLALRADGTMVAWGNGTGGRTLVPTELANVTRIAAGAEHSLALRADGRVFAWGNAEAGRLAVPAELVGVVGIAAGQVHSLALKADGGVVAWGGNEYGQKEVPYGLGGVVGVAAGSGFHSLALRDVRGDQVPVITSSPLGRTVDEGAPVVLTVAGNFGTAPLRLQWRKNGVAVSGATGASYRIAEAAVGASGEYDVVVTNYLGSATSGVVTVLVNALTGGAVPRILVAPVSVAVLAGSAAMFRVEASGTAPLSYQWKKNAVVLAGATNATLEVATVSAGAAGGYAVEVRNALGAVVSGEAALTVFSASAVQATTYAGYVAGTTLTVSNTLTFTGAPASLGWQLVLPPGWSFGASTGRDGEVKPAAGATDALEWAWTTVPTSPVNFSVVLNVPAGSAGAKTLAGVAIVRASGAAFTIPLNVLGLNQISAPVITSQPVNRVAGVGTSTTMTVGATGQAPLGYAWSKNGVLLVDGGAILGSQGATLSLSGVSAAEAGVYTCRVSNPAGAVVSNAVTLVVMNAAPTHAVVGAGYTPGTTVMITNTITFVGAGSALGWSVLLPNGWRYAAVGVGEPAVKPDSGSTDLLEWAWTTLPVSPVTFTYGLQVPGTVVGDQTLAALVIFRAAGAAAQITAKPDPLVLTQVALHSADTDRNFRIGLLELTRMIELFNTRNSTNRTGAYRVDATGEDGFSPEPTRTKTAVVTLASYHSADSNRDGKVDLFELTRLIELYNFRVGTSRTGDYHTAAETEDGFAPGPGVIAYTSP
jgi:alpha-tubulin suppressor-like RCC1 family protein